MAGTMQIITWCVRSGAYEQDLQTLDVRKGQIDINGRCVMLKRQTVKKKCAPFAMGTISTVITRVTSGTIHYHVLLQ